jgi:type IV secretory pathway TraG/TraD family ATPase VirD4
VEKAPDEIVLGVRDAWGREAPVSLFSDDRRQHVYMVGKSGTGKTTLLRNMILQDIEAGRGVGVIDPHGDLAADLLDHIPRHRIEHVTYFDPSDPEHAIGFNLLARVPPDKRHLVASGVVAAFKGIFPDFFGPRMEYIFYAAVAALLDCQNVSLLGLQRMLTDERYRAWVVNQVKDPVVRAFWEHEFEAHDRKTKAEMVSPILNKVGPMLMTPQLRNILGQIRSRIDARFMMDKGRIFIANLSKGKLGADKANLLGSFLVAQFQLAAMARADVPESDRRDFFLYVDEFQSFVSDSFSSILSEARKYHLCLTLSHQYLNQLKPGIADAVIGNVGSMVAFRVGHQDAEALELAYGRTYPASAFTSLSNGEIYAKLLSRGQDLEPFLARTFAPRGERHCRRDQIICRSRTKYTIKRDIVERRINQWLRINQPRKHQSR